MHKDNQRISILHIITGLGMGGAEKVVYDLCNHSKGTPFEMHVISLSKERDREQDFSDIQIPVHVLNLKKNIVGLIDSIKFIKHYIKSKNIDILHVHMTHGLLISNVLNIWTNTPVVFTAHSYKIGNKIREWYLYFTKWFRSVDVLFSFSQLQFYHKQKGFVIIPNGIDLDPFDSIKDKYEKFDPFTFIHVGRLINLKNQELLIRSAKKLSDKGIPFKLLIAGDGENRLALSQLIEKLDLSKQVKLMGLQRNIPALLMQSHVFLLSSHWEGFPISLLEAGAARLPILTTAVGSIPDLITENCGVLSDESSFSSHMEDIWRQYESKYKAYGQNFYDHIKNNYTMEHIFEQHIKLYTLLKNQKHILYSKQNE